MTSGCSGRGLTRVESRVEHVGDVLAPVYIVACREVRAEVAAAALLPPERRARDQQADGHEARQTRARSPPVARLSPRARRDAQPTATLRADRHGAVHGRSRDRAASPRMSPHQVRSHLSRAARHRGRRCRDASVGTASASAAASSAA